MKLNYFLTEVADRFDHRGKPAGTQMVAHLIRNNGKKACKCSLKVRGHTLSLTRHELEELPEGAYLCNDSADELSREMGAMKAFTKN